jgi:hypothetical protein
MHRYKVSIQDVVWKPDSIEIIESPSMINVNDIAQASSMFVNLKIN